MDKKSNFDKDSDGLIKKKKNSNNKHKSYKYNSKTKNNSNITKGQYVPIKKNHSSVTSKKKVNKNN